MLQSHKYSFVFNLMTSQFMMLQSHKYSNMYKTSISWILNSCFSISLIPDIQFIIYSHEYSFLQWPAFLSGCLSLWLGRSVHSTPSWSVPGSLNTGESFKFVGSNFREWARVFAYSWYLISLMRQFQFQ